MLFINNAAKISHSSLRFKSEDVEIFLRNVGTYVPNCTVSYSRILFYVVCIKNYYFPNTINQVVFVMESTAFSVNRIFTHNLRDLRVDLDEPVRSVIFLTTAEAKLCGQCGTALTVSPFRHPCDAQSDLLLL